MSTEDESKGRIRKKSSRRTDNKRKQFLLPDGDEGTSDVETNLEEATNGEPHTSAAKRNDDSFGSDDDSKLTAKKRRKSLSRRSTRATSNSEDEMESEEEVKEKKKKKKKKKKTSKRRSVGSKKQSAQDEEVSTDKLISEDGDGNDVDYEVEKIIEAHENTDGTREFLVRWKGLKANDDTWEPEENLQCPELIKDFIGKQEKKEKEAKVKSKEKSQKKPANDSGESGEEAKVKSKEKSQKISGNDSGESSETEYEVKRIIEVHHKKDGGREFLVQWKGYSNKDNSWEPEQHLNCPKLIARFERKLERAKGSSKAETRVNRRQTERLAYNSGGGKKRPCRLGDFRQTYYDQD